MCFLIGRLARSLPPSLPPFARDNGLYMYMYILLQLLLLGMCFLIGRLARSLPPSLPPFARDNGLYMYMYILLLGMCFLIGRLARSLPPSLPPPPSLPSLSLYITHTHTHSFSLRSNPLGHRGVLADEFSFLMKSMWSGQYRFISPRDFKVRDQSYTYIHIIIDNIYILP